MIIKARRGEHSGLELLALCVIVWTVVMGGIVIVGAIEATTTKRAPCSGKKAGTGCARVLREPKHQLHSNGEELLLQLKYKLID